MFLKVIRTKIREQIGSFQCGSSSKIVFDEDKMHLEIPLEEIHGWKMNGLNQLTVCFE